MVRRSEGRLWQNRSEVRLWQRRSDGRLWQLLTELKLTDNVKCEIAKHLSELGVQLRRYFPKTDDTKNWIRYPFHALPPVHLPISEQDSIIEVATSGSVKM